MKRYTRSSELQRAAEEALRNIQRLKTWRRRWAAHTNANRVKRPVRHRQYMHTRLPEAVEAGR